MLEEAGLVRIEKNRGVFVRADPDRGSRRDLRPARGAGRDGRPPRSPARSRRRELKELRALVDAHGAGGQGRATSTRYHLLNLRVPRRAGRAGRQPQAARDLPQAGQGAAPVPPRSTWPTAALLPISAREHRQIVKAIASGDADAAGRAMYDHVMDSSERTHRRTTCAAQAARRPTRRADATTATEGHADARHRQRPHLPLARQPTVVVCVDGCEPDYIDQAVAHGRVPWLKRDARRAARRSSPTASCP